MTAVTPTSAEELAASIDAAPLTGRYWATYGLIVTLLIGEIFDFFVVGFLVAGLAPKWGLTFGQSTIMLLSAGVGAMVGALIFGRISDRYGRKVVVVACAFIYCLGAGAISLIPDGAWLIFTLLRFMVGVGYGGAGASQFALIVEYTPTRWRTPIGSSLGIPASLGVVLASVVVAALYPMLGWRGVAALGVLPLVLGIAIAFVAPESPRWLAANGRGEKARAALSKMIGHEISLLPEASPPPRVPIGELWRVPRRFWLIVLVQLGIGTAYAGVLLWGPTIVAQVLRVPPEKAAATFIWVSLAGTLGRCLFVWLPMKIGRVKSGWLHGYGGALFLGLAAIFHADYLGMIPLFLLFLVCGQVFFDGGFSNLNPYAAEVYPVRSAAMGTGLAAASGGLGKIVGPLVMGLIAGTGNLVNPKATMDAVQPAFLFLAFACLVAGLAYSRFGIETHRKPIVLE